jgi:hypothetical protein
MVACPNDFLKAAVRRRAESEGVSLSALKAEPEGPKRADEAQSAVLV